MTGIADKSLVIEYIYQQVSNQIIIFVEIDNSVSKYHLAIQENINCSF